MIGKFKYLNVSFESATSPKFDDLRSLFDAGADDWIRYSPTCWMLYTKKSADDWFDKIEPLLSKKDTVFVCALDFTDKQGWLPQWVWDWMNTKRPM